MEVAAVTATTGRCIPTREGMTIVISSRRRVHMLLPMRLHRKLPQMLCCYESCWDLRPGTATVPMRTLAQISFNDHVPPLHHPRRRIPLLGQLQRRQRLHLASRECFCSRLFRNSSNNRHNCHLQNKKIPWNHYLLLFWAGLLWPPCEGNSAFKIDCAHGGLGGSC